MAVHASNNPFSCSSAQVDGEALDNLIEETVAEQGNQAYTQKGGYPGTTAGLKQELEDQINSINFEGIISYDTLADLQAVTPIPADGTTAKVAKDTVNPENNGNWYVSGGVWVQFDNTTKSIIEEDNDHTPVNGKAVVLDTYKNKYSEDWQDDAQINSNDWILSSGGSIVGNKVTINSNESSAKIRVPNNTVIGQKYILLFNVYDFELLNVNATGITIINYTQDVIANFTPNNSKKIYAQTFVSSSNGVIQLTVKGSVNSGVPTGTNLVSFNSDFLGVIPWTQEKEDYWYNIAENYNGVNFESKTVPNALNSKQADNSTLSDLALESEIAHQTQPFFTPTNKSQLLPNEWILSSGGLKNSKGEITIFSDNSQAKIQVPNTTVVGEKYVAFGYVFKPVRLDASATGLSFYNHSQLLFDLSLDEDNFNYSVFNSSVNNLIQVLVSGNVNVLPNETPVCSFVSNCLTIVEWSQELEDLLSQVKINYKGGYIDFGKNLYDLKDAYAYELPTNSFETIQPLSNKVTDMFDSDVANYSSVSNVNDYVYDANGSNLIVSGDFLRNSGGRLRIGLRFLPQGYATENRKYAIVFKGSITSDNTSGVILSGKANNVDIFQDLEDGIESSIETIINIAFEAGENDVNQYVYLEPKQRDVAISLQDVNYDFDVFSVFDYIEGFSLNDYLEASSNGLIVPKYSPIGTATESYVNNEVSSALGNVSKLSANDLIVDYDVEMIGTYGQSLAVGAGGSDASSDYKNTPSFALGSSLYNRDFTTPTEKDAFFGSDLILMEDNSINEQYPPAVASLNSVLQLIEKENKVDVSDFGYQLMPFTGGLSGSNIQGLIKGTAPYDDYLECITQAKLFTNKQGKTFAFRVLNWVQGEGNANGTTQLEYYNFLNQFVTDFNADVKAITGQSEDVNFVIYQTSPWLGREVSGVIRDNMNVQEAQVEVVNNNANCFLSGAMYQFAYSDDFHPVDRAVVGLQQGVTYKRIVNDGEDWVTFQPVSHTVFNDGTNYYTRLKFDVPVKPMRFDVSGDAWHNPNGMQPNYGFELLSSGVEKQTALPFIVKGDTVVLTSTENPIGMTIRYAVNGHAGGGNLCDSQNIIIRNKNTDYVIDNFAVGFSEYIID